MTKDEYEKMQAKYRYLDYFRKEWNEIRVLVVQEGRKTSTISLLEFGPRGKKPGDTMRVHNKSIIWPKPETQIPGWHAHTDI